MSNFKQVSVISVLAGIIVGCSTPALHNLVAVGDHAAVMRELERGANADGDNWHGHPIGIAVENDDLKMVELLHENGATIAPQQLVVAVQQEARTTYSYLAKNGADLDFCLIDIAAPNNGTFLPPLGFAITQSDVNTVQLLLSLGAAIETDCVKYKLLGHEYRYAAILGASYFGSPQIVATLIRHGAEVNRLNTSGLTPIAIAAAQGHYEIVRILLANGAFHSYTTELKQPIEYAIDAGHSDVVNLLSYAGAVPPERKRPLIEPSGTQNAFLEGVKLLAQMYVVYLGARYSDYDPNYAAELLGTDETGENNSLARSKYKGSCRHDNQCGAYEICAKSYGQLTGVCVKDETNSGKLATSYGAGPSDRGYAASGGCPVGYERDLVYGGCKK